MNMRRICTDKFSGTWGNCPKGDIVILARSVVNLLCDAAADVERPWVDRLAANRPIAVTVLIKRVVRGLRAKGIIHCRAKSLIANGLRSGIRIRPKYAVLHFAVVARQSAEIGKLVGAVSNIRMISVQHSRIGSRNKRVDRCIRCRPVILLRHIGKVHLDCTLLDRVVSGRECAVVVCAAVFQIVVAGIRRIDMQRVVHALARAYILTRICRSCRVECTIISGESCELDQLIRIRDNIPCGVLCNADHIPQCVVGLREGTLDRRGDVLFRDDPIAVRLE